MRGEGFSLKKEKKKKTSVPTCLQFVSQHFFGECCVIFTTGILMLDDEFLLSSKIFSVYKQTVWNALSVVQ